MKRIRINPVFRKEIMTGTRSMKIALTLLAYNGILAMIGLIILYAIFQSARYGSVDRSEILLLYTVLAVMEFAMILFVIPAYTSSTISGERERQTLEILLTTTLRPHQVIFGKLLSSISTVLLLVFSSVPVIALVFTVGGIAVSDLLQFLLLIVVTAVYAGSFGMLFSVLFKRTTISTVFTYGMLVVLGAGTLAILGGVYLLMSQYYNAQYYAGVIPNRYSPDLGYGVTLLFLNPAFSIASMLCGQYGSERVFSDLILEFGTVPAFVTNHWFGISLVVQLVVSALVLFLASLCLNPLHERSKAKKGKKKKTGKIRNANRE